MTFTRFLMICYDCASFRHAWEIEMSGKPTTVRLSLTVLAALLMTMALSPRVSASEDHAQAAQEECEDQWMLSEAHMTCLPSKVTPDPNRAVLHCKFEMACVVNMPCTYAAPCGPDSGAVTKDGITWQGPIYNVANLRNCGGAIGTQPCG